jgi:hypothetical protein
VLLRKAGRARSGTCCDLPAGWGRVMAPSAHRGLPRQGEGSVTRSRGHVPTLRCCPTTPSLPSWTSLHRIVGAVGSQFNSDLVHPRRNIRHRSVSRRAASGAYGDSGVGRTRFGACWAESVAAIRPSTRSTTADRPESSMGASSPLSSSMARRHDWLDGLEAVDHELLRTVRTVASGLEVRVGLAPECRIPGNWLVSLRDSHRAP